MEPAHRALQGGAGWTLSRGSKPLIDGSTASCAGQPMLLPPRRAASPKDIAGAAPTLSTYCPATTCPLLLLLVHQHLLLVEGTVPKPGSLIHGP